MPVRARRLAARAALTMLAAVLLVAAACSGTVRREPARLRMAITPVTARVFVDDRFRATARVMALRPLELAPGVHVLTIEAPGHFPHDLRVDLPEGETRINLELRPIPP